MSIERSFTNFNISLEGVSEMFYDYICGELDVNLENYIEEYDHEEVSYSAEAVLTNGETYHIYICLDEDGEEWYCLAENLNDVAKIS